VFPDFGHDTIEVGARSVQLVDKKNPRQPFAVSVHPDCLCLRLYTAYSTQDNNRPVNHSNRADHLGAKVNVTRGVDEVDPVIAPMTGCGG
jgi:hypothetical protein